MGMTARFPKGTMVIYRDKENNEYKGEVIKAERVEDTDFFSYTVKLFAKMGETGDPNAPKDWQAIQPPKEQRGVSDYSMEFP